MSKRLKSSHPEYKKRGFALIVTLSLMILLTIIAVGLLTLSSISLKSTNATSASLEAKANARLSMMLAIGQLQSLAGQDTRVTAPSDLLSSSNTPVTGVWRSWEGTDHDATGKPIVPNYTSKNQAGDANKAVGSAADGKFLGWLTSTAANTAPDATKIPDVAKASASGLVPMVAGGSVVDTNRRVYMKPTMIKGGIGSFAWWTSGDNSKAMINTDRSAKPASTVAWQERVRSNGRADAKSFGLENVNTYAPGKTVPTTGNLKLVNPAADLKKIHDLTGFSRGLLTNTATGGWRRDLSLFSERFSALPSTNLPLFTLQPGNVQTYSKAQPSSHPNNPLIYPWSRYRASPGSAAWQQVPPICSWTALADYMVQYKSLNTTNATRTAMPVVVNSLSADRFLYPDQVRRSPQIARIQWIYSLCSSKKKTPPPDASKPYRAALMITPVLTLWNPYNVELTFSDFGVNIQETAPLRFKFKVGTTVFQETTLSEICKAGTGYQRFNLKVNGSVTLPPGGTRIFGLNDPLPKEDAAPNNVVLTPGFKPNGGFLFFGINKGNDVWASAADAIAMTKISYDAPTAESGKSGIGIIYDISLNGGSKSAHRMIYNAAELGGDPVVNSLYPPLTRVITSTIGEVEELKNQPFASALFGYRMASPLPRDPKHNSLHTRGMLQTNPLCYYTEIGFGDDNNAITTMQGTGVYHPINAPYDFAFDDVQGWNDTMSIPQWESGTKSSYIVSGLAAGDGLTRCIMAELPTRPLQSLAELQHFDARNNNPITPFQFNLIGNGSAHPIFAPDQVAVSTTYNNGMCNDDGYMLNHLLFDDWFVSSIATDTLDFSQSTERSINDVYKDHLELTTSLPNRFYLAARGADFPSVSQAVTNAVSAAKDIKTDMYAFESIASKLEVDGMFNINSVSLEAWKALLRQNRNAEVPYLGSDGQTRTDSASSYSYPRTTIAGDRATNSGSGESNGLFPAAAEFSGHRALTDAQIDALAEEIVTEIRKRGPFLSLAEFLNRKLTTDKSLAIAGTIQKALDNLAELGNSPKNPFLTLQNNSFRITTPPAGNTDYKFPEAALGWSAFGVPGWVRQADILRPLAPIISARDDTFTIRAYGDSRDRADPTKIAARAWCEVVVQRQADYVDPSDPAEIAPYSSAMKSTANKRFGRRYEVISFRWLTEAEI